MKLEYILYFQPFILLCRRNTQTISPFIRFLSEPLHKRKKRGAQVLQPFAVLTAVEQHFVHHDEQFAYPVGIELASEILVGVECHIVSEDSFQEVQKRTFARVAFFRHEQQDG